MASVIEAQVQSVDPYLTEQIITYIGNKRKLLPYIEAAIKDIQRTIGKSKMVCADLFSGSGIVARMLKPYSSTLITNDMEDYSKIINECYLTNKDDFNDGTYQEYKRKLDAYCKKLRKGIIADNYAPKDDTNIQDGERVFYTTRNAMYIDTAMTYILKNIEPAYQKFFIAPLLYEASVHANTSGVFKGFYKNSTTGRGQYGGNAQNCLERITSDIKIKKPILSDFDTNHIALQGDTNEIVKSLQHIDVAYLDPPYNQHGYGSNYFMLNTILHHKLGSNLSRISGIPNDWNRSNYNKKANPIIETEVLEQFPLVIAEVKHQGTNDKRAEEGKSAQASGNAIERLGKNLTGIKAMTHYETITPFICFGDGCDFMLDSEKDKIVSLHQDSADLFALYMSDECKNKVSLLSDKDTGSSGDGCKEHSEVGGARGY